MQANTRLTTAAERDEIFARVEEASRALPEEDLHVLGYHEFLDGLTRGIAAHHAGLLPAFKQVVEELFQEGLVKAVFATETLALGINMPARTVVIEKLSKWNGETHADLTPGEYTQLTGRAGRRGLDIEGHGVVLYQPGMNPGEVAGLASTRTYPLRSSFRPSYNMAVNLVHQFGRARSRELLEQSFAQFQADKAVVGLARQVHKAEEALDGYREAAPATSATSWSTPASAAGSPTSRRARPAARAGPPGRGGASLGRLRPGDVIQCPPASSAGSPWSSTPGTSATSRAVRRDGRPAGAAAGADGLPGAGRGDRSAADPEVVQRPQPGAAARPGHGRCGAEARERPGPAAYEEGESFSDSPADREIGRLRAELKAHPCHQCPEREDHARWAERYFKLRARHGDPQAPCRTAPTRSRAPSTGSATC